jgi:PAS domain S-box-containing protein
MIEAVVVTNQTIQKRECDLRDGACHAPPHGLSKSESRISLSSVVDPHSLVNPLYQSHLADRRLAMTRDTLAQQIETIEQCLEAWQRHVSTLPDQQMQPAEVVVEELSAVLERLPVTAEEPHLRNNELEKRAKTRNLELAESNQDLQAQIVSLAKFPSENPNPVLRFGPDGIILYANEASDPLLQEWGCVVGGYAPEIWRNQIAEVLASQSRKNTEVECAGQVFSFVVTPISGAGYVNLYGIDITERKRVEQERERLLAQVEQQRQRAEELAATAKRRANELDAVFAAMTDAVAVYDTAGMATRANLAAIAIYGSDLMNIDRPTLARRIGVCSADGRLATAETLPGDRALRGEKVTDEYFTFTDSKGRNRVALTSASPLFTDGNLSGAVVVWHDVTEHEQILAQLENERARLRTIIEKAPEAIVVMDQECHVILSNPAAESLGVRAALCNPAESPLHCEVRYSKGTPGDSSESPLARSVVEGRTLKNIEMTITYPDGKHRVFLGSSAPIKDRLGNISSAVGVFEDITQREQMEKALEQSNHDMLMLNRLGQELGSTLDLSQVLGRILDAINVLIPAENNAIWLWDEERSGWLVCRAASNSRQEQSPLNMRLRVGEGIVGWVAEHRESVAISHLTEDQRFAPGVYMQTGSQARSILAVPLLVRDRVAGVLTIINRTLGEFDARDRTLVETLAASAAIAVENARLHDQAMQAAVTAERNRLARDLHDAVSQTLFSASVISEALPRLLKRDPSRVERGLEQLHQLTRGALAEMRALLVELRPTVLAETDLGDLLHQLAEATMSRTRIAASVSVEAKRALPPEVQIALYRIAQEALNNVVKHARASQVTLNLCNRPEQVELRVKDDGRGFDPDCVKPGHLGLDIMRERAQSTGISLKIASQLGQGTEIVATFAGA